VLRRASLRLLTASLLLALLPPAAAVAAPGPGDGALTPQLAQLARPAVQALGEREQALRLDLAPSGPGSLIREGDQVLVEVRTEGRPLLSPLRAAGARIVAVSPALQRVTAAVVPADLEALAAVAGVAAVEAVPAPILAAVDCEGGSVISEGVAQLHVESARTEHGVTGAGATVGVLSDSFDQATKADDGSGATIATKAATDVETGDLPGPGSGCVEEEAPVQVLHEHTVATPEVFDEGRAMLQTVHDVAPQAKLAFASAFNGELAFAEAIEGLAAPVLSGGAGAGAIVDDVSYFEEPFFQNGPVAVAVEKVVGEGVPYVSAAGNDNLFDSSGNEIGSWETPKFRDAGSCPATVAAIGGANGSHCLDFDPGAGTDTAFGLRVGAHRTLTVDLQWDEPWNGVTSDEDAYLLNQSGATLLASAKKRNVTSTQKPVEVLQWTNTGAAAVNVQLAINRFSGGVPRTKFVLLENGAGVSEVEYPHSEGGDVVGPAVFGHAGAAGAITVGASRYDSGTAPEGYSSRGPVTHYFGPVAGATAAAALASPEVISKPDVTATDCAATTFFAEEDVGGTWRFCGTSGAAPHVAGVVALLENAAAVSSVVATPAAVRAALEASATPVGAFGACAVGAGLVEANGAITALLSAAPSSPPNCEPPASPGGPGGEESAEEPPPVTPPGPVVTPTPVSPAPLPTPTPQPTRAPATTIRKHPAAVVRTSGGSARLVFAFGSDQSGGSFLCQVDRGSYRACPARLVRSFAPGAHVLRVEARSAAGVADQTPAVFRFRVVPAR
jgi:hypothetical protein